MTNPSLEALGLPDVTGAMMQGMQFLSQSLQIATQTELQRQRMVQEAQQHSESIKLQRDNLALEQDNLALKQRIEDRRAKEEAATAGGSALLDFDQLLTAGQYEKAQKLILAKQDEAERDSLRLVDPTSILDPDTKKPIAPEHLKMGANAEELRKDATTINEEIDRLTINPTPAGLFGQQLMQEYPDLGTRLSELRARGRAVDAQLKYVTRRITSDPIITTMKKKYDAAWGRTLKLEPETPAITNTTLAPSPLMQQSAPVSLNVDAKVAAVSPTIIKRIETNGNTPSWGAMADMIANEIATTVREFTSRDQKIDYLTKLLADLRRQVPDSMLINDISKRLQANARK